MNYNHFEYMQHVAERLIPIGHSADSCHFIMSDEVEEILTLGDRISNMPGMLLLAIDGCESEFNWNNGDSLVELPRYLFAVVDKTSRLDPQSVIVAKRNCSFIAKEILKKMMHDSLGNTNGLGTLDIGSFSQGGVGPIGDTFFGVMVGFSLTTPIDFSVNEKLWKDGIL